MGILNWELLKSMRKMMDGKKFLRSKITEPRMRRLLVNS